ncbi:beta-galactosidase [Lutibacter citreus]|uniref:beta-galactosidase n=1 Tax=Lutibacter citreus TaxID=2138210 RepID=UPI000DBE9022|nr:beta-galactosidase [Lutibacter citreus]
MKQLYFLFVVFLITVACSKQKAERIQSETNSVTINKPIIFDVSNYKSGTPRDIPKMVSIAPNGDVMKVNSNYISINNTPWIPSYGEFQYQRYPAGYWEDALLKMKSQGFTGVAAYTFWIGHEEEEGKWDFTGRNDIRRFIKLCQKHGLKFFARIGPWVNGEYRNGGHPDWLVKKLGNPKDPFGHSGSGGKLRSTAPEYLAAVDKLYEKLGEQMEGLYWKDGGPIFAVQLDNEYTPAHSGIGGTELIEREKEMALKYGMDVALYTTTGWNKAEFIQDHTIQVHGSYADYFWGAASDIFRTPALSFSTLRAVDGIDTEVSNVDSKSSTDIEKYINNPYLTCETGIGMNIAYHRRPNVDYLDNAAVSLVELGSGCNGMGYFMNIGGNNPIGKLSYMNRDFNQGPIENSIISNDFQGAIGEFGQVRKSFHEYPVQLNFMTDFGKYLAPCRTFIPAEIDELRGKDLNNSLELQRAIRTDGKTGFIFVNNHVKNDTVYNFKNVQFNIKLKDETLTIPEKAIEIPVDSYFYWPFNLTLSNATIKYATAQPVLHLKESNTYVFFKNEGIEAKFLFENTNIKSIKANKAKVSKLKNLTKVEVLEAGLDCYIDVNLKDNLTVKFIILTQKQAKQLYKNDDKLYLSDAEVVLFNKGKFELISKNTENLVWVYPRNTVDGVSTIKEGLFDKFEVNFKEVPVAFDFKETQDGKDIKFKNITYKNKEDGNVGVPNESVFDKGTKISLSFPKGISKGLYDVRVLVDYEASALRLYKNGKFIYDNYYNGTPWEIGTKHLLPNYNPETKLELKIIPLQPKDPIYLNGVYWPNLNKEENVLEVKNIKAYPIYKTSFELKN